MRSRSEFLYGLDADGVQTTLFHYENWRVVSIGENSDGFWLVLETVYE